MKEKIKGLIVLEFRQDISPLWRSMNITLSPHFSTLFPDITLLSLEMLQTQPKFTILLNP